MGFRDLCLGFFPKLGEPLWGPYNKNDSSLGSILGCPYLANYHSFC